MEYTSFASATANVASKTTLLAQQTTHTNSSLTADTLNVVTTGDASIMGGNLHGATGVSMDIGGDLTLESVQDRFSGSSQGAGISGGTSLGGVYTNESGAGASSREVKTTAIGQSTGVSGANAGVNASSGRYSGTETVVSSITGGTVNVDVDGHTQLTGSVVAAVDSEGNDTGELQLSTGSLEIANLTNRSYSSNQSIGVNASVGITESADPADPNQSGLNSSNYSYQNESSQSLDKTLATIGEGGISVGGEATDPEGLNRDIDEVNKELYAVDRQQGNVDLTVDHRLLSEDGRKQIAEDAKRTQILGSALIDIVESSVSLIGVGEGESSVREHVGNTQDYFTATKNFTQNEDNAEHVETLGNPDATPEQKQAAYTALVNEIATFMGVDPTEAKVLMENDPQFAGVHSRDSGTIYVEDRAHENATEAVTTVGHETQHYLDNQENPDAEQTQQYHDNRENYAEIMGAATADYLNFNFSQNGHSLATTNHHSMGSSAEEALRNAALVAGNNAAYNAEDPDSLDHRYLHPEEQELAEQLAQESDGRFTAQEMRDTLRHAQLSDAPDYPQGMSSHAFDTAQASEEAFEYLDGSEGRLVVTQDANGNARYILQDINSIPLNDDAKDYITQQDLGYSFYEPAARIDDPSIPRDTLTGRPLDDTGRYKVGYNVDGNIYSVPHYSCATADCLSQQLNVDWSSPEGQAYRNALTAQGLDDLSTAANVGLLISPVGPWATALNVVSTASGFGSAYMKGELINKTGETLVSDFSSRALGDMLGERAGGRANTLLDLSGYHESTIDVIPDDRTVVESLDNYFNGDDNENE